MSYVPMTVAREVMTVRGAVPVSDLGRTLPHEHLFIDMSCYLLEPQTPEEQTLLEAPISLERLSSIRRNPYGNRDNCLLADAELACAEVTDFKNLGGGAIVDVTLPDIGRDVLALCSVSERTGVHVIAGCGHYIVSAQPAFVKDASQESITERLLTEITEGIDDTGIKPGIIGEIGTGHPIDPIEIKVLRAAAAAQKATGLALTVHVHAPGRRGHEVLDVLDEEGVDLSRVVLDHLDASLAHADIEFADAVEYHLSLAARGCYIEYDLCGNDCYFVTTEDSWWMPSDRERAKALVALVDAGHRDQLLLSQDVGLKHYLTRFGGWGYGHVLSAFAGYLRDAGLADSTIERLFTDNPHRMLAPEPA